MSAMDSGMGASLIDDSGREFVISAACSIGRSSRNDVVLLDDEVSRSHAIVNHQGANEHWVLDLGSSNGTRLNGRILTQPSRLTDGDVIRMGAKELTFHCEDRIDAVNDQTLARSTIRQLRVTKQWLLLGDIIEFTPLSQRLKPEELARVVGRWMNDCRLIVEEHGGSIYKYLGDGWFGGWEDEDAADKVAACLKSLLEHQRGSEPGFRVVVHIGDVTCSGSPAGSELGMLGPDVNLLFRMEKLAGKLKCPAMASASCEALLEGGILGESLGTHPVAGFEEEVECYRLIRPE